MKLRRSLLWVPSNKWDRILEGINSNADCIVLDLEDLVPIKEKVIARDMACKALKELNFRGKERIVRINPINTTLGQEDIAAITKCKPDAIRLPKCESTEYILQLDNALQIQEEKYSLPIGEIKIILMIETAIGILKAYELSTCSPRIIAIGLGAEDLTTDLKTTRSTTGLEIELLYARQKLIMDGRAAGVDVIDSSCLEINNADKLREETSMIKQMGFDGKSVIHVSQIPIIHEVFSPTENEIRYAKQVIEAYEKSQEEGSFYTFLNGKLIDVPVVEKAKRVIMLAEAMKREK